MTHKLKKGGEKSLRAFAEELKSEAPTNHRGNVRTKLSVNTEIMNRQTLRRADLRRLVPLSDTTIYELERKGDFPKRFFLTPRCVVWPLNEVLAWLDERKSANENGLVELAPSPDVRQRAARPVRGDLHS